MSGQAAVLAQALARHAEAVCRYYLPHGRRHGRYWLVGDISNTPGRSLYVRLAGPDHGPGAAGKWTDYVAPRCYVAARRWAAVLPGVGGISQHNLRPSGRVA